MLRKALPERVSRCSDREETLFFAPEGIAAWRAEERATSHANVKLQTKRVDFGLTSIPGRGDLNGLGC